MIPNFITRAAIVQAMRRIDLDGIPPARKSRGHCLAAYGRHFPPKYTIALAHEAATGKRLHPDLFSAGPESNNFLRRRGFDVEECNCGGTLRDGGPVTSVSLLSTRPLSRAASTRHSERCPECKRRVRELLERIHGTCVAGHRFGWRADLYAYADTSIGDALWDVATALREYRGFGIRDFVRSSLLAGCDFWVPDPGFIVEFDESQHFTHPRKLALSVYADAECLGFSARHWITLCEHHDARDNRPPFRDEQRAWYDTLRDLVPSLEGLLPTVRLYARDRAWCALDADSAEDRARFAELMDRGRPRSDRRAAAIRPGGPA